MVTRPVVVTAVSIDKELNVEEFVLLLHMQVLILHIHVYIL